MEVQENVPLAQLTTFKIGGNAKFFKEVFSGDELVEAIIWSEKQKMPYRIIAGGSNLLIESDGFQGLIIKLSIQNRKYKDEYVSLGAGNILWDEIICACKKGLVGWENLAGIPGSIGGAVRGNAGAFGTEIGDLVDTVKFFDIKTKSFQKVSDNECEFSYRSSIFKKHPEHIIVEVNLHLSKGDMQKCLSSAEDTVNEREKRHLQNVKAAGSYFMNPVASKNVQKMFEDEKKAKCRGGRVPAGWLIEKAACKGCKIGGAMASEQHPNYIVNINNARSADVLDLAEKIKKAVHEKFDVELTEEVSHIGKIE